MNLRLKSAYFTIPPPEPASSWGKLVFTAGAKLWVVLEVNWSSPKTVAWPISSASLPRWDKPGVNEMLKASDVELPADKDPARPAPDSCCQKKNWQPDFREKWRHLRWRFQARWLSL